MISIFDLLHLRCFNIVFYETLMLTPDSCVLVLDIICASRVFSVFIVLVCFALQYVCVVSMI